MVANSSLKDYQTFKLNSKLNCAENDVQPMLALTHYRDRSRCAYGYICKWKSKCATLKYAALTMAIKHSTAFVAQINGTQ